MGDDDVRFEVVDPRSESALTALRAYFGELDTRFDAGFDAGRALTADAGLFEAPVGAFVVGFVGDDVVACGAIQDLGAGVGEIKRMWVSPAVRGQGLGRRTLLAIEEQVAVLGHSTVRLDTNSALTEAIALYTSAGYTEIERYNDNPDAMHWFEKRLR